MRLVPSLLWLALCAAAHAFAQTAPPQAPVTNLESVVVSGVQPGPGLWKVSKGDHVMWVLGTLSPLPDHMQWKTDEVEQAIAASQEVLGAPSISIKPQAGFFGKMFLLPSLIGARKSPDGISLQQALPPAEYARWETLKQKYIGSDRSVESWRPLFAAAELYEKAVKRSGMNSSGGVKDTVRELAKKHNVKVSSTRYEMLIEEPRAAVKTFKGSAMEDRECFSRTLDTVEHGLPQVVARANAWAVGDIEALRGMPMADQREACIQAVTGAGFAEKLGFKDIPQHIEAAWMSAATRALENNTQTFAMLPMQEVLSPNGYLAKLKAKGYTVQSPDEQDAAAGP
jgi:hypothetical protein